MCAFSVPSVPFVSNAQCNNNGGGNQVCTVPGFKCCQCVPAIRRYLHVEIEPVDASAIEPVDASSTESSVDIVNVMAAVDPVTSCLPPLIANGTLCKPGLRFAVCVNTSYYYNALRARCEHVNYVVMASSSPVAKSDYPQSASSVMTAPLLTLIVVISCGAVILVCVAVLFIRRFYRSYVYARGDVPMLETVSLLSRSLDGSLHDFTDSLDGSLSTGRTRAVQVSAASEHAWAPALTCSLNGSFRLYTGRPDGDRMSTGRTTTPPAVVLSASAASQHAFAPRLNSSLGCVTSRHAFGSASASVSGASPLCCVTTRAFGIATASGSSD